MSNQSKPDWAAIRLAYETTDEPAQAICRRHGVSSTALYNRIAAEGWKRRRPDLSLANRRAGGFKRSRAAVIEGLYRVLEKRLAAIEAETGEGADAAKRDIEACATIVRLLERLAELMQREAAASVSARATADTAGANKGSNAKQDFDDDDAERLRREIALRLARLAEAGEA